MAIEPLACEILDIYNTWGDALRAADLDPEERRNSIYTAQNCIEALRDLSEMIGGGEPTKEDYRTYVETPPYSTIISHYGSFEKAKRLAGVDGDEGTDDVENVDTVLEQLTEAEAVTENGDPVVEQSGVETDTPKTRREKIQYVARQRSSST